MVLYLKTPAHARATLSLKRGQYTDPTYLMLKYNFYLEERGKTKIKP